MAESSATNRVSELADSLSRLAAQQLAIGRASEAVANIEEAVAHYRELAAEDPDRHANNLATTLDQCSSVNHELGREPDALTSIEEAVELRRELAKQDPNAYLPDLAMSLNNLSNVLDGLGRSADGLAAVEEAVTRYRELTAENAERYLPELAMSLNNLSSRLGEVGLLEEALATIEEAVELRRRLAAANPGTQSRDLAIALNNLSNRLAAAGRHSEALAAIEEAVEMQRGLAKHGDNYLPELAMSLNNLSSRLAAAGRLEQSLAAIEEAVKLRRRLADESPEQHLPELAGALNNLSNVLDALGRPEDSLIAAEEAVERYQVMAERTPERYLPDLAGSLNNLATVLNEIGRQEEALSAINEAVDRYRQLVELMPSRYLPDLAMSLNNLSAVMNASDRNEDGVDAADGAVEIYDELAERSPGRFLPHLATAFDNLCNGALKIGRDDLALASLEAAIAKYGEHPESAALMLTAANLHARRGEVAEAVTSAWAVLEKAPDSSDSKERADAHRLLRSLRARDRAEFDAIWDQEVRLSQPLWLRHLETDRDLTDLLFEWLDTETWDESRSFLRDHAAPLLTEAGEAALEHLIDRRPGQATLADHLEILRAANTGGIDATYDTISERLAAEKRLQRLREWLDISDAEESLAALIADSDELLSPDAEQDLLDIARTQPESSLLFTPIGLLGLSRSRGAEAVYPLLANQPLLTEDGECLRSDEAPDVLACARMDSGRGEQNPDSQFRHALAAMAAGHTQEADDAIIRCRPLLPSWERLAYRDRLRALATSHPDLADSIGSLEDRLLATDSKPGESSNPLVSVLRGCAVRIDGDGEMTGTGFFVSPDVVLTCAQCVRGATEITVSGSDWRSAATVESVAPDGSAEAAEDSNPISLFDLVLLRVAAAPTDQASARLEPEEPQTGAEVDPLRIVGFVQIPGIEDPILTEASPSIAGSTVVGGREVLLLSDPEAIAGLDGAPILNLRTGAVCGILHGPLGKGQSLGGSAIPISEAVLSLPGLLERNHLALGDGNWNRAARIERKIAAGDAAKLPLVSPMTDLTWRPDRAPSDLLNPRYGVVGLLGREELQGDFARWRESEERFAISLITGGGGFGKTRLAIEECVAADAAGWTTGLLTLDPETHSNKALDRLTDWPAPLFIAVDYAETRPATVGSLIVRIARQVEGQPVRLILICRQAQALPEMEDLFAVGDAREEIATALRRAEQIHLDRSELDRQLLFKHGAAAFAERLGASQVPQAPPALRDEHFARPLFVLAAALLCVEDPATEIDALSRDDLMLELIDRHESEYWERWNQSLDLGIDRAHQSAAVALATLLGAEGEGEALALVAVAPGCADLSESQRQQVARWLSCLYSNGRLDDSPAISPVEPDMLGEALVSRQCSRDPQLIGIALDVATTQQLVRTLTVLNRAAVGDEAFTAIVRDALEQRLAELVARAVAALDVDEELLGALDLAVAGLSPGAAAAAAVAAIPEATPVLASLTANLHRAATEHKRRTSDGSPKSLTELATSLGALSQALAELGRSKQALEAAEEGVAILRGQQPEPDLSSLALLLSYFTIRLMEEGQTKRALVAGEEAVDLYRQLFAEEPELHRHALAMSLNNLSNALGALGREEESLTVIEETVERYRELFAEDPDAHGPSIAISLNNLSIRLQAAGRSEEALGPITEAVAMRRQLLEEGSEGRLPELAGSLNNLSTVLAALGQDQDALAAAEEATALRRQLAARTPERYLSDLAISLNNLSNRLGDAERAEDALTAIEESTALRRQLAARTPERYLSDLAGSLTNLSGRLDNVGRSQDGLAAAEEAVKIYRELTQGAPERHWPDLVTAVNNLSGRLAAVGQAEAALAAAEEATNGYRELASRTPERYLPRLASCLNNLSNRLSEIDKDEEAVTAIEEAVELERQLADRVPERHLPDLAKVLNNFSDRLVAIDRHDEAVAAVEESVERYRELAAAQPERYLPVLAVNLGDLAKVLERLGRGDEARAILESALTEHPADAASAPLMLATAESRQRFGDLADAARLALAALGLSGSDSPSQMAEARLLLRELRAEDTSGFDKVWNEEDLGPQPPWLRCLAPAEQVTDDLLGWLQTPSWEDSRKFLEDREGTLLGDEAEAALEHLIDNRPGQPTLERHLQLLRSARADGVASPYERIAGQAPGKRERDHRQPSRPQNTEAQS